MATRQTTIDALLDQLAGAGKVTARKMFGEACLYLDDVPVALVFDDQLYVKWTEPGRAIAPGALEAAPFPSARPWLLIPADQVDSWANRESLCQLLQVTRDSRPPFESKRTKRRVRTRDG